MSAPAAVVRHQRTPCPQPPPDVSSPTHLTGLVSSHGIGRHSTSDEVGMSISVAACFFLAFLSWADHQLEMAYNGKKGKKGKRKKKRRR